MKIFKQTHRLATFAVASLMLFSCSSDDDGLEPDDPTVINPPIVLDCSYFGENPNVHLTDDPNAPVDYTVTCDPMTSGDFIIDAGVVIAFESDAGLRLGKYADGRSEEHTSELQSRETLLCRLPLGKKTGTAAPSDPQTGGSPNSAR